MNTEDFIKVLKNLTKENITFDEPHISKRCEENNITRDDILYHLFKNQNNLINVVEDRKGIYKIYFKLSKKRQFKLVVDISKYKEIKILTVRIVDKRYSIRKMNFRKLRR